MSKSNLSQVIALELTKIFNPIQDVFNSTEGVTLFLRSFGWEVSTLANIPSIFGDLKNQIDGMYQFVENIIGGGELTLTDLEELFNLIKSLVEMIKDIETGVSLPTELTDNNFHQIFPRQLLDYLLVNYLFTSNRTFGHLLATAGIIRTKYYPEVSPRISYSGVEFSFEDIPLMLENPSITFENAYGWNTGDFNSSKFFLHLESLLATLGLSVFVDQEDEASAKKIQEDTNPLTVHSPITTLNFSIFSIYDGTNTLSSGFRIGKIPQIGLVKSGIGVFPYLEGSIPTEIQISDSTFFSFNGNLDTTNGLVLIIRPDEPLKISTGFKSGNATSEVGSLNFQLKNEDSSGEPITLLGTRDGGGVSYNRLSILNEINLDNNGIGEMFIELEAKELTVAIAANKEDGFLSKILPKNGIRSVSDITLGLSTTRGFYFKGDAGLEIKVPTHISLGPIDLLGLTIGLKPKDGKIPVTAGADVQVKLGPITGLVENLGIKAIFDFPSNQDGNLGFLDLDIGFKSPNGIGLSIDTAAIKGGGYLYIDQAEGRYAGVAGLNIKDKIQLSAFGLINTKLPSGKKGYSFLLFISAEFTPIQLGFGFTLNGVGGIVGIHRTIVIDKLRAGVKTGAYDRLLFPSNPVEDALEIISDLRAIFPPEEGRYVFGIMGKLGWGSPTLITAEIGLILEVPNPVRVAILGVVSCILPDTNKRLLVLNVNFLGVIDFGKKQLSFDATIYDSSLLRKFTLAGDMALRVSWGSKANFLLSVGGFHPSYQPPPGLVNMTRLTLSLLGGDNPRLTLTTYFAVTSNTVQFGAKVEAYVRVTKRISAEGFLSFDALFQFSPFYMNIMAAAYMAIKWKGKEKFSVTVQVSLEGPTPWTVDGLAKIKICGIKAKVKFNKTWGNTENTSLPTVQVTPKLEAAFGDIRNWQALLPAAYQEVVKLRKVNLPPTTLLVHPMGRLRISQKVLPLNLLIQLFGNQEVSDGGKFEITKVKVGGFPVDYGYVKEDFAPSQFRKMDETKKLSSPSFVKYDGGVQVNALSDLKGSGFTTKQIKYETIILGAEPLNPVASGDKLLIKENEKVLTAMVKGGAAGRSGLSFSPKVAPLGPKMITILEEKYGVVWTDSLELLEPGVELTSFAEAVDVYANHIGDNPSDKTKLKILPEFEIQQL